MFLSPAEQAAMAAAAAAADTAPAPDEASTASATGRDNAHPDAAAAPAAAAPMPTSVPSAGGVIEITTSRPDIRTSAERLRDAAQATMASQVSNGGVTEAQRVVTSAAEPGISFETVTPMGISPRPSSDGGATTHAPTLGMPARTQSVYLDVKSNSNR